MKLTVKNVLILNLISSTAVAQLTLIYNVATEPKLVVGLAVFFAMFNILMTKVAKVWGFEFDVDEGKMSVYGEERTRKTETVTLTEKKTTGSTDET